jgi:hypothetical protein
LATTATKACSTAAAATPPTGAAEPDRVVVEPEELAVVVVGPGAEVEAVVVEARAVAPGPLESQLARISAAATSMMTRALCRRRQKAGPRTACLLASTVPCL